MFRQSWVIIFMLLLLSSCAVKAPEVRVTGERTALEQEVLGAYEELEQDTYMVASTRSAASRNTTKISPEKKKVLEAYRTIKFNQDDVDEFKRKGLIGENNEGLLELRPAEEPEDQESRQLAASIVEEQNTAREVIVQRMIEVNPQLQDRPKEEVMSEFARMNQNKSVKGTWIQQENGVWVKKKSEPVVS